MLTNFTKMHGCGNDFVILDERAASLGLTPTRAAGIADRHRGVGCDQFIVIERAGSGATAFMRIRNPDGSEAGACAPEPSHHVTVHEYCVSAAKAPPYAIWLVNDDAVLPESHVVLPPAVIEVTTIW